MIFCARVPLARRTGTIRGILHHTIGMTAPAKHIRDMDDDVNEARAVSVISHDGWLRIAATRDMVDGTGHLNLTLFPLSERELT